MDRYEREDKRVPDHIRGITCSVRNCIHNDGQCYCTAERISVGPCTACSCGDTVCATFENKSSDR